MIQDAGQEGKSKENTKFVERIAKLSNGWDLVKA
jgi:hypothetical protein